MNQNSKIFNKAFDEILEHVSKTCINLGIDFYLAGAVARDYHLNKMDDYSPPRKTEDIDIAVMVAHEDEYITLKNALIKTGFFTEHKEPIKLMYKNSVEVDLLPFGQIEQEGVTRLENPRLFSLDMAGFTILNEHAEDVDWANNVKVCPIEGIVLLKLIANNDRPSRTKDLLDIQLIIKLYFDVYSDGIYEDHFDLLEIYDVDDLNGYKPKICSHVIGRKLKTILAKDEKLKERIITILKEDKDAFWQNILTGLTE